MKRYVKGFKEGKTSKSDRQKKTGYPNIDNSRARLKTRDLNLAFTRGKTNS